MWKETPETLAACQGFIAFDCLFVCVIHCMCVCVCVRRIQCMKLSHTTIGCVRVACARCARCMRAVALTVLYVLLLPHAALRGGPLVALLGQRQRSEPRPRRALAARRLRVLRAAVVAAGVLGLADHGEGHPAKGPLEKGYGINHPESLIWESKSGD